jgi:hypothetical protein
MKNSVFASTLLVLVFGYINAAHAADKKPAPYPSMAPAAQYRMASAQEEIALARSAAPPSISADAEVLVLGEHGYGTAVKGKNGFVCLVERAWDAGFDDPGFWNPKIRGPDCYNPAAVRSVMPQFLKRAEWALAGVSRQQMQEKTRALFADGHFTAPEPGAFAFMLSKQGYLGDDAGGPWLPHVMFFVPHGQAATWGAGLEGSPILGSEGTALEPTVLFVPVRRWSDGTPAPPVEQPHKM